MGSRITFFCDKCMSEEKDNTKEVKPYTFSINGVTVETDLCPIHATPWVEALGDFQKVGRKIKGEKKPVKEVMNPMTEIITCPVKGCTSTPKMGPGAMAHLRSHVFRGEFSQEQATAMYAKVVASRS